MGIYNFFRAISRVFRIGRDGEGKLEQYAVRLFDDNDSAERKIRIAIAQDACRKTFDYIGNRCE